MSECVVAVASSAVGSVCRFEIGSDSCFNKFDTQRLFWVQKEKTCFSANQTTQDTRHEANQRNFLHLYGSDWLKRARSKQNRRKKPFILYYKGKMEPLFLLVATPNARKDPSAHLSYACSTEMHAPLSAHDSVLNSVGYHVHTRNTYKRFQLSKLTIQNTPHK